MQKLILITLLFLFAFSSCNQKGKTEHHTDPLEAGREFIDASLKGNYDEAKKYILPDSLNLNYFDGMKEFYKRMPEAEKEGYKNANIIINNDGVENVSDSITIINYTNTFKNKPTKIKLIKQHDEWWVDFKYTFSGNL